MKIVILFTLLILSDSFLTTPNKKKGYFEEIYQEYDPSYSEDEYYIRTIPALSLRSDFILGFDASNVAHIEENGGTYYDLDGIEKDIFEILSNNGVNTVRIRLFKNYHNAVLIDDPKRGPYTSEPCGKLDLPHVLYMAKRIKENGMKFLLDLQYSDFWADPGSQFTPYDWKYDDLEELLTHVYEYTEEVLNYFAYNGIFVDYIQIGNEVDSGMLDPLCYASDEDWESEYLWGKKFDRFAMALNSGIRAVRRTSPYTKIIIHSAKALNAYYDAAIGGYKANTWFFEQLTQRNVVDYDIIGSSFYPYISPDTPVYTLTDSVNEFALRFNKPVVVMETSQGFTFNYHRWAMNSFTRESEILSKYKCSIQGQTDAFVDIVEQIANARFGMGLGVFYWGGEWLPVQGVGTGGPWDPDHSTWANQALFTYDGLALPTLRAFSEIYLLNKTNIA